MFSGHLLKFDGTILPLKFIQPNTYSCKPNQTLDGDTYTDNDGFLRRSVLPHTRTKIDFYTPPIFESEISELRSFMKKKDSIAVEYFNTGTGQYASGTFYMADPEFIINNIDNDIIYDPIRIALVEY